MLPKKRRLRRPDFKNRPIQRVRFSYGTVAVHGFSDGKASVVVSKKLSKSAVQRNALRRKLYAVLRPSLPRNFRHTVVVYPNQAAISADFRELTEEIGKVFSRLA